ncbi:MAG: hypothetical protein ACRCTK_04970 [Alphaproteobacteria bacterium]
MTSTLDVKMLAKELDIPFQEVASEESSKSAYFQISAKGIGIPSDTVLQTEQDRFMNAIYIQGPYLAVIAKQYEVGEKTLYQPFFEAWIPKPEAAWNLKPEAAKQIQEGQAVKGNVNWRNKPQGLCNRGKNFKHLPRKGGGIFFAPFLGC